MPRAYASSVIPAPVAEVWTLIRDFNGLPDWHPAIADSEIEGGRPADSVGCIRSFHLGDGTHLREQLLVLDDVNRTMTYDFRQSPFPVRSYHGTLRASPVTDEDHTFVEWSGLFDADAADEATLLDTFANGVFRAGLDALKQRFET